MRTSLPVLALTGVAQQLNVPAQLRDAELRVANESALTLRWTWGDQSGILYPSEVDVWRPDATSASAIQLVPVDGILTGIALTSNLVAEIAWAPDRFAGDYPQQMSRLSQTASNKRRLFPDGVATPALPTTPSFTVPGGLGSTTKIFSIDPGTVAIRLLVTAAGLFFTYNLLVLGNNSVEQYFGDPNAPGTPLNVQTASLPLTIPIEFDWDTKIQVSITNPSQALNVFVSALLDIEAPGQVGAATSVTEPTPQPWQAPASFASVNVSLAGGGGSATYIGLGGAPAMYLHGYSTGNDGANAAGRYTAFSGGNPLLDVDCRAVRQMDAWGDHKGLRIATALVMTNQGGAASFILLNQDYTIGI